MNALTTYTPPAFSMSDIERVALAIAKGGLFGSSDPNAVLTLCLLAQAEGQHPAVVFRDYHIIQGKPAKKADAMLRDFVSAGGKVEWHKLDDTIADATFSHSHGGTVRIDWTMERARVAGLATPMWKKYPRQMLRSRVISEGVRSVYPGATSGLYEVGEVQDIVAETPAREPQQIIIEAVAEEAPRERKKLEGPYTSASALKAAYHKLERDIRGAGDLENFEELLADPETEALIEQMKRDAKGYVFGSDKLPAEHVPLMALISQTRTELQAMAEDPELRHQSAMEAG